MLKGPAYKGLANPIKNVQSQHPIGVKKSHPIGQFQIGRKSESKKVKEIFGNHK